MKREAVHSMFSMVLQDTWTFEGSVRENLVYNKENVSDMELERACRACGIYSFICALPHGFDTVLNENTAISAGQNSFDHSPRHDTGQPHAYIGRGDLIG